jgi:hypothetical protein
MRRFAERVLPVLQRDPVFAAPADGPIAAPAPATAKERLFAPA